jgi:hypothetical protein
LGLAEEEQQMTFCREARQREAQQSIPQQRQGHSGFPFLGKVNDRPKRLETFERCHAHLNKVARYICLVFRHFGRLAYI